MPIDQTGSPQSSTAKLSSPVRQQRYAASRPHVADARREPRLRRGALEWAEEEDSETANSCDSGNHRSRWWSSAARRAFRRKSTRDSARRASHLAAIQRRRGDRHRSRLPDVRARAQLRSATRAKRYHSRPRVHSQPTHYVARPAPIPCGNYHVPAQSDLALSETQHRQRFAPRKFSGNSLRVKRTHLLYHGTLLYAFDLALIEVPAHAAAATRLSQWPAARRFCDERAGHPPATCRSGHRRFPWPEANRPIFQCRELNNSSPSDSATTAGTTNSRSEPIARHYSKGRGFG